MAGGRKWSKSPNINDLTLHDLCDLSHSERWGIPFGLHVMKVCTMVFNAQLGLHGSCPFDLLAGQYYNSGLISVYCYKSDVKDIVSRPRGNTRYIWLLRRWCISLLCRGTSSNHSLATVGNSITSITICYMSLRWDESTWPMGRISIHYRYKLVTTDPNWRREMTQTAYWLTWEGTQGC